MAFPTTSILDNFNRANGNNVYSNGPWGATPIWSGDTSLVISSNAAKANGSWGDVYTNTSTYTDSEAYATISSTGGTDGYLEIMVRGSGGNSGNPSYYSLGWSQHDNHDDTWRVYRSAGGAYTQLGAQFTQAPAVGHRFGISAIGSSVIGYYDTGSGFVAKVTTSDTTHTSGRLGFEIYNSSGIDDFGGGTPGSGVTADMTRPVRVTTAPFPFFHIQYFKRFLKGVKNVWSKMGCYNLRSSSFGGYSQNSFTGSSGNKPAIAR
ncbi:MAG: hypothetical protein J0I20_34035 [Chloroflexi bacterium]|nr:hypothetical protein [Chloroflexota bacterium]OJW05584.1 MAG: hypothetical protein BGO39_02925 [Chloroflexi bacterium 54-19]